MHEAQEEEETLLRRRQVGIIPGILELWGWPQGITDMA
jgi:hypothetical protein